jgi:hypothetical protein
MRRHWHPGQHIAVFNPTGGGKSYLVVEGLLRFPVIEHARVLMIDDKGNDQSTRVWGQAADRYPPGRGARAVFGRDRQVPEHYRLVVPDWHWTPQSERHRDPATEFARSVVADSVQAFYDEAQDPTDPESARNARASVLVIDELYSLVDRRPPSLDLAPLVMNVLRRGRYRALSVICLSQMPVWIPNEVYSQTTHLYLGGMQDQHYRERLREIGGNTEEIEVGLTQLRGHEFLFLGDKGRTMMITEVGRE